jgi:hypothetical protein
MRSRRKDGLGFCPIYLCTAIFFSLAVSTAFADKGYFAFQNMQAADAAAASAEAKYAAAKVAYGTSKREWNDYVAAETADFHQQARYFDAQKTAERADADATAAHDAVMAKLRTSSQYTNAVAAADAAASAMDSGRDDPSLDIQGRMDLANAALKARSAVSSLETSALASDDNYQRCKQAKADADSAVEAMDSEFTAQLKATPQYTQLKEDADGKQADLASAEANDSEARSAYDAAKSRYEDASRQTINLGREGN